MNNIKEYRVIRRRHYGSGCNQVLLNYSDIESTLSYSGTMRDGDILELITNTKIFNLVIKNRCIVFFPGSTVKVDLDSLKIGDLFTIVKGVVISEIYVANIVERQKDPVHKFCQCHCHFGD